jgi:hypothetical protein
MATAKKAAAPAPVLVKVRAFHPIRHDGTDYAEQEVFELPEPDAAALVAGSWAELAPTGLPALGKPLDPSIGLA